MKGGDVLETGKIAKSITMKQSYYDKLTQSTFVFKTHDEETNGYFKPFNGIPVIIDDNIQGDFEFQYYKN